MRIDFSQLSEGNECHTSTKAGSTAQGKHGKTRLGTLEKPDKLGENLEKHWKKIRVKDGTKSMNKAPCEVKEECGEQV